MLFDSARGGQHGGYVYPALLLLSYLQGTRLASPVVVGTIMHRVSMRARLVQ